MEYLRLLYGEVYYNDLENLLAMDELVNDSKRMEKDMNQQKREFFNKLKKSGQDYDRL